MDMIIEMIFNHSSSRFEKFAEALDNSENKYRKLYTFLTTSPKAFQGRWPLKSGKKLDQY